MDTKNGPSQREGRILFSLEDTFYELISELETTNHGERVLLAWECHGTQARQVVVRSLPPTAGDPEERLLMRARLEEEARLATYLDHPGIARVRGRYEVGDTLYVVSQYVEGASLNTLLTAAMMRKVRLSEGFVLYVGAEVARALHHAHTRTDEQGNPLSIVHRDVNPARIYLGPYGEVILTDFAHARSLLPGRVVTYLPRPHGEAFYASPEALLGEPLDLRADLFALGLVLLELATWRSLYATANTHLEDLEEALSPEVKQRVLSAQLMALEAKLPDEVDDYILRAATYDPQDVEELTEELPPPLRPILRKLLQRRPEDRYPSAEALEVDFRAGLAALGAPYGASEAVEEVRCSLDGASKKTAEFEPLDDGQLPPSPDAVATAPDGGDMNQSLLNADDITTSPGGA
jgi:serine/threonine-protein kinase